MLSVALLSLMSSTLALSGCGRSNEETKGTGETSNKSSFKVALVMSGPASDNGWNASALKGLNAVQKELNLPDTDVAHEESRTTDGQREESLRGYASQRYNVIFAHGHEYEALATKMEKEFPKTLFVVSSSNQVGLNTTPSLSNWKMVPTSKGCSPPG